MRWRSDRGERAIRAPLAVSPAKGERQGSGADMRLQRRSESAWCIGAPGQAAALGEALGALLVLIADLALLLGAELRPPGARVNPRRAGGRPRHGPARESKYARHLVSAHHHAHAAWIEVDVGGMKNAAQRSALPCYPSATPKGKWVSFATYLHAKLLILLVAGEGFEPPTLGL